MIKRFVQSVLKWIQKDQASSAPRPVGKSPKNLVFETLEPRLLLSAVTIGTTDDVLNGDTSSITNLIATPGVDGISLREAIIAANNSPGADSITLPSGTYMLTGASGENAAASGDLDVTDDLTISGAGAATTIVDGGGNDRVFDVRSGVSLISGLTIQNGGNVTQGGGLEVIGGGGGAQLTLTNAIVRNNSTSDRGGGIYNDGILTLTDVEISGNTANDKGGGLFNTQQATLTRVTISGNSSIDDGAGIFNANQGISLSLTNVTISGNMATSSGGGLFTLRSVDLTNVTVASNSANGQGGGIFIGGGQGDAVLKNTILANNTGNNANRALTSLGNNIDSDGTAALAGSGDQVTDPMLGPLQDNGGPTQTHALLAGSPAINAGTNVGAPTVDQRGLVRDATTDIGAFEFGVGGTNSAPVLDAAATPVLNAVAEDAGAPSGVVGTLISDLVDFPGGGGLNNVTDADGGTVTGIAISAADTTNGTWHYSIDGGTNWNPLGAVATNSARLLAANANTRIYFQPNADYNGTISPGITFRAWDQTSGVNGGTANTTTSGGTTAFSSATDTADLTVTPQNDPPSASITLPSYAVTESTPLTLHGTGLSVTDPDAGSNAVRATLSVGEGSLTVVAGTSGVTVSNSGSNAVTLDGTLSQLNTLLAGNLGATIAYQALAAPSANTTLTLAIDDLGNSGSGTNITASDNATLNITAQNDAPTASIGPTGYAVTDGVSLVLHGTGLSVSDPDAGANPVRATLTAGQGILTVATGTSGVTVTGSGTGAVTLDGTLTQLNDLLAGNLGTSVVYLVNNPSGANTSLILTLDDLGNAGTGGTLSSNDTATLDFTATNDAPSATITQATYAISENTPFTLHGTGLVVADLDAGANPVRVTLTVGEGTLTVGAGTSGVTVTTSGTSSVTLDGTLAQVNTLLAGNLGATIAYQALDAPSANTTLTLAIDDLGNTGAGGPRSANDAATLNITAENDGPSATITPATFAVSENTPLTLHGTGLSVSDPDAGNNLVRATLAVGEGTLTVGAGTSGVTVTGSGTASVTLEGTVAQLNTLLAGNLGATVAYQALDAPSASTTLTLAIDDLGNTGTGGQRTANDTATLNITAANDAPSATIGPTGYAVTDGVPLTLHGTGLSVADLDAGANSMRVTLSVGEGTLTLAAGTTGVTVAGSGTSIVTLDGTVAQLNTLLAGNLGASVVYLVSNPSGAGTPLVLTIDDLGNTGAGGSRTANDTATLDFNPANDAPVATIIPATFTFAENTPTALHTTGLSVADLDAGDNPVRATLSVGEGSLTVAAGTTGVTITGSGTGAVTLDGTVAQLNDLLAGDLGATIDYQALAAPSASTTLTLAIDDLGNTGTGGPRTASDTATLIIIAENDAPSATITPATFAVAENIPLTLHGMGLTVSDPDAGTDPVQAILAVGEGTLTVAAGTTGVTVAGSGSNSVTLNGTVAQLNNLLAGNLGATIDYQALDIPSASTILTLTINDLGNTGTGGPRSANDTATLNIAVENDAPVATITPTAFVAAEGTPLNLHGTGLVVGDSDAGANSVRATLSVGEGTLTVTAGTAGVTVTGSGTTSVTLEGSVSQINDLLAGNLGATVVYQALDAPSASTPVTLTIDDLGNSGAGSNLTATDTATLTITAGNDAPTAISLSNSAVDENTDTNSGNSVGTLSTTDPDSGDTATYTIVGGADATRFSIGGGSSNELILTDGGLDHETKPSYEVTVRVTDSGGLTLDRTFIITVRDLNDKPIMTTGSSFTSAENTSTVGTLNAIDEDQPTQDLAYAITGGADAALFSIDSTTGVLTFTTVSNFESPADATADNIYQVEVTVDDGNGGSASQTLLVTVTDTNEQPSIADATFSIDERSSEGTIVGELTATDPDTGDLLTFAIVAGNSEGTLAIDNNARLTVANNGALRADADFTVTLIIRVTDSKGLTATATVTVQIQPAIDTPPLIETELPFLTELEDTDSVSSDPQSNDEQTDQEPTEEPDSSESDPDTAEEPNGSAPDLDTSVVNIPEQPDAPSSPFLLDNGNAQAVDNNTDSQAGGPVNPSSSSSRPPKQQFNQQVERTPALKQTPEVTREAEPEETRARTPASENLSALIEEKGFVEELDELRDEVREEENFDKAIVGSTLAATTGLSVGYVLWLVRGGMLLSSVLSSLPAWRLVDPLPVLASLDKSSEEDPADDDSLESVLRKARTNSTRESNE